MLVDELAWPPFYKGFLFGTLVLNPVVMSKENGSKVALTDRFILVLQAAFRKLRHDVVIYRTYQQKTGVFSSSTRDEEEIKHLANFAFAVFVDLEYDTKQAIAFLERVLESP